MRALVVDPTVESTMRMADVAEPRPRPDQLVVQVAHIGLNFGEVIPGTWTAGVVQGHDAAGVVVESARDGSGPASGTPVVFGFTPHAWAERVAVPTHALAPIPQAVDPADAAALPVAGVAALRVIRTRSLLGRRVLVTGANGGVGRFGVQLAALAGARVTALTSDLDRAEGLQDLGALDVVDDPETVIPGVDVVLDTVGGPRLARLWSLLAAGGSLHTVGFASGQPTVFPAGSLFDLGSPPKTIVTTAGNDDHITDELEFLLDLLAHGRLSPEIGWRDTWERADEAVAALRARRVAGKIVLDVDSAAPRSPADRSAQVGDRDGE